MKKINLRSRITLTLIALLGVSGLGIAGPGDFSAKHKRPPAFGNGMDSTRVSESVNEEYESRCDHLKDSLEISEAPGRTQWAMKCTQQRLARAQDAGDMEEIIRGYELTSILSAYIKNNLKSLQTRYPTYGVLNIETGRFENPLNFKAPIDPAAPCEIPDLYEIVAMCRGGCYASDQRIVFESGELAIGEASRSIHRRVLTLQSGSSLDHLSYQFTPVASLIRSLEPSQHQLVRIKTLSGKVVKLTTNHPLLLASGMMVDAESIRVGSLLVSVDGSPDPVISVEPYSYYGRVYNLSIESNDLAENVVAAEGILNGSAYYQNEGTNHLNRILFRINLPEEMTR